MERKMLETKNLLDLSHTLAEPLLSGHTYPWECLPELKAFILRLGPELEQKGYRRIGPDAWAHETAVIAPTAFVGNAVIIGPKTEVRHGAFIRGSALVGEDCVVGNSTELKNVILFDGVQVPHYNYVGDSVLGCKAHMGAGAITSNIKADKKNVTVRFGGEQVATGLRKMGAVLGDYVDVGCNSVMNPGSVIGRGTHVYPLSFVRGYIPEKAIYKRLGEIAEMEDRD